MKIETLNQLFDKLDKRACEYLKKYNEDGLYIEEYIDPNQSTINHRAQIVQQVREELFEFIKIILQHRRTILQKNLAYCGLQIGLGHFGSTHWLLSQICTKTVTVEFNWEFIERYITREKYDRNKDIFIYGSSINKQTIKQTSLHKPFDTLLIDGNHTYKYVKQDFDNYYPMLNWGGICAFHDTIFEVERYGVKTFVDELREQYDIKDIIYSTTTGISYFIKD